MTDRDRAWDAEHHRAALQIITEADRGLRVAEHELKGGRLMDARETVRLVRGLLPPLERAIQRRPVRADWARSRFHELPTTGIDHPDSTEEG